MGIGMCFLYPHILVPPIPKHRGTLHNIPPHRSSGSRHDFTSLMLPDGQHRPMPHAIVLYTARVRVSLVKSWLRQTTVGGPVPLKRELFRQVNRIGGYPQFAPTVQYVACTIPLFWQHKAARDCTVNADREQGQACSTCIPTTCPHSRATIQKHG